MKVLSKILSIALLIAMPLYASAQTITVKGNVKDAAGLAVIGASVIQQGTSNGVITDLDGNYSINVPANATLQFSSIGYVEQAIAVAGQSNINVVLEEDAELLEETVVIGYGVQKKSDLTGAVASIREGDLKNRSVTDAGAALQGKAAGVQIINNSGAPGTGAQIRVRGYSSNSDKIGPLLIVDGLKVDNIQYLDPSLIESMEVLKDAASAAIYGAEAGNGVVLVTTKKGQSGHSSITYDGKFTLQSLGKKAELHDAASYVDYQKYIDAAFANELSLNGYNGESYNWFDAVFAPSWAQQHGITFQGGNDKGHFLMGLNYLNNDGIVRGDKDVYKRLTAQINADWQIKKWLKIATNNSIEKWSTKSVSQSSYGSSLNAVMMLDPLTPPYYSDIKDTPSGMQQQYALNPGIIPTDPSHNGDFYGTSKYLQEATGNPLFQRDRTDSSNEGVTIRGNIEGNLTPVKGLVITSRFGYRISQSSSHSFSAPYWITPMASGTDYNISAGVNTGLYYNWENFANYNRSFGKHNIGVMAGMSYIENTWDNASISAQGPDILKDTAENFRYIDFIKSDINANRNNAPGKSASLAYFGRITYNYDNRYGFQANFRADAFDSSKLSPENRWGYFPSFSAGWTISNEPFFKDNIDRDAVSFLKLRGSWGRNGNINVLSGYQYSTTVGLKGKWYQGTPSVGNGEAIEFGSMPSGLANPNLKWETSEQWDLGLDARFLADRLTLGVDWYNKVTKDLLVSINPVPEIGVASTWANAGSVLNRGLELELGWKDHVGDFHYSIHANFATLHNEVLDLHSTLNRIEGTGGGVSGLNYKIRTAFEPGYPLWYFRGIKSAGVDPETGRPKYYNADGEIVDTVAEGDLQYIGKAIPDYTYGLTINMAYKGFDMVIFGTGVGGNDIFSLLYSADRTRSNTLKTYWENSWKEVGDNAKYPDLAKVKSDWWYWSSDNASIFNGAYFKIKQIQLGYTLPENLTRKALISNLRVFVSLDDFFTISSYPGCDPETATTQSHNGMGYDAGTYPTTKKAVFGVNLTF